MSRPKVAVSSIQRRELLYAKVRDLVMEQEAMDRSLESVGEAISSDEALDRIVRILAKELKASTLPEHIAAAA